MNLELHGYQLILLIHILNGQDDGEDEVLVPPRRRLQGPQRAKQEHSLESNAVSVSQGHQGCQGCQDSLRERLLRSRSLRSMFSRSLLLRVVVRLRVH